jgi:anthranilate phosphoribosyltransferase
MLRDKLANVVEGHDLNHGSMAEAMGVIMEGMASDAQIAAFLTALRLKGETEEEIAGAAQAMRDRCIKVPGTGIDDAIDTCGTGGDGAGTVNPGGPDGSRSRSYCRETRQQGGFQPLWQCRPTRSAGS